MGNNVRRTFDSLRVVGAFQRTAAIAVRCSSVHLSLWALVIAQARRISGLQGPVPSADVTLRVGSNLIDAAQNPHWIRGEIENEGDRAAEGCRLKLLRVEGQNVVQARKIENGELQWQGGGCGAKTLDPEERLVFDIGTRKWANNSPLVLLAFF